MVCNRITLTARTLKKGINNFLKILKTLSYFWYNWSRKSLGEKYENIKKSNICHSYIIN